MPFFSKEKGRMSHLLKMKSKIGVTRKERVVYDVPEFTKRPRDTSKNPQSQIISATQPETQPAKTPGTKKVVPKFVDTLNVDMEKK